MINEAVKICGLTQLEVENLIQPYIGQGVNFTITENALDVKISMSTQIDRNSFEVIKSKIYNLFEERVYASMDIELEDLCVKLLKLNNQMITVAESLTGGLISSRLCSIAGASEVFYEGIVCYNKKSKIDRLGVHKSIIGAYGTISKQTAYAMVTGMNKSGGDIALAITGLAGPNSDEGKPVGLVYIAVGAGNFITVFEKHFVGDRNHIRECASNCALFYLVRYLKGDILRL